MNGSAAMLSINQSSEDLLPSRQGAPMLLLTDKQRYKKLLLCLSSMSFHVI